MRFVLKPTPRLYADRTGFKFRLSYTKAGKGTQQSFFKSKSLSTQIEVFKEDLIELLGSTNDIESEEFHKISVINSWKKSCAFYFGMQLG